MGRKNRLRRDGEGFRRPGEKNHMAMDQGLQPPFCPLMTAGVPISAQAGPLVGSGAQSTAVTVQAVNLPCMKEQCMFWDQSAPPQCGITSLLEEVLLEADDEDDGYKVQD